MIPSLPVAVVAFLAVAAPGWAQEEPVLLPSAISWTASPAEIALVQGGGREDSDLVLNAALHGRYSMPFGSADRDVFTYGGGVFVVDQHLAWNDVFNPGWGFEIEVDLMFGDSRASRPGGGHPGFDYGACFVIGQDSFSGGNIFDSSGNSIHVDHLTMGSILVGGKVLQIFDRGIMADGRFCLGAVHYSSVGADFGSSTGSFHDEFLKDTWTFEMDLRAHGGIRLGPLAVVLGIGFRFLMPPNEGPRVDLNSSPMWTFDIDLGVELGF